MGRQLLVGVVGAAALTAFAVGSVVLGLVLAVVAVLLGSRLVRRGVIGVDQRAADREGPPNLR